MEDEVEEVKDIAQVSVLSGWDNTVNTAVPLILEGYVPKPPVDA